MYKNDMVLVLEINSGGCLFGQIYKMIVDKTRIPHFIVNLTLSVCFDEYFYAHVIKKKNNTGSMILCVLSL